MGQEHLSNEVRQLLVTAGRLAQRDGASQVTLDHVRQALAGAPGPDG
jgi:hypothetical protein